MRIENKKQGVDPLLKLQDIIRSESKKSRFLRRHRKAIKKRLVAYAKKHRLFSDMFHSLMNITRRLRFWYRTLPLETADKLIFFESFKGRSYACNPRAIFEYLVERPEFQDYCFIWSFRNPKRFKYLEKKYPNTLVIRQYGKIYETALAMAKYWITNYRLLDHIIPGKNQVYVQCWHGTPLKRLGCDLEVSQNPVHTISEIKRKYRHDAQRFTYLLSPSPFATEKFVSAWDLNSLGKEHAVIEQGYPRNDGLFHVDVEKMAKARQRIGLREDDGRKIILYAPTWRDNQHQTGVGYVYDLALDIGAMQAHLGEDYILLCRLHYLVANKINFDNYRGFAYDVSNFSDINTLYHLSDLLITDYSSVFFDYANLKKPMIFYMYDLEQYRDEIRGFYLDLRELPGKIVTREQDLVPTIVSVDHHNPINDRYEKFLDRFNPRDDGRAAQRVAQIIFDNDKG